MTAIRAAAQAQQDLDDLTDCLSICGITAQAKINGKMMVVGKEDTETNISDLFSPDNASEVSEKCRDQKMSGK